jgi:hypothetical protein
MAKSLNGVLDHGIDHAPMIAQRPTWHGPQRMLEPVGDALAYRWGVANLGASPTQQATAAAIGLAALAETIRKALDSGAAEQDVLRDIIQCSDDFTGLDDPVARRAFLVEPPSTGDPRFEAFLAGLAVHLCRQAGMEMTPAWTRDESRYLDRMWWFGLSDDSGLRAFAFQRTPSCMRARGVIFNAVELESV